MKTCWLVLSLCWLLTLSSPADETSDYDKYWPQWRGPEGTGMAPHGDPPVEWSEEKNVRWKLAIPGEGHASPIVWGEVVYVLTAVKTEKTVEAGSGEAEQEPASGRRRRSRARKPTNLYEYVVMAVDRKSGKVLWQKTACEELPHEGKHADGSWASPSPVTDGERLYAYFGSRGLFCYDMEGELLWKKNFGDLTIAHSFGEGTSPALHGDMLVINWDHEGESFICALNKKTGKEYWRKERDEPTSWGTPLIVDVDGDPQIVVNGTNRVRGYDLTTGFPIWECGGMTRNTVPTPIEGDGRVFVMSGFRGAALVAIDLAGASKDVTGTETVAWTHDKRTPYVPSPLLDEGRLYFLATNTGVLSCFDADSGEALYTGQKLDGIRGVYSSPVGAQNRVYFSGRNGVFVVIKNSSSYEVLARNSLDDSFSASPAIVGDELYLRGFKSLYCIACD